MTGGYTPSENLIQTLQTLQTLMEEEGVPDPGIPGAGLSQAARRVLFLLDYGERTKAAAASDDAEPAKAAGFGKLVLEEFTDSEPEAEVVPPEPPACPTPQPGGVPAIALPASGNPSAEPADMVVRKSVFLKNARIGEPYDGLLKIDGATNLSLDDAAGSGLAFDEATARLTGTPATSGDVQLRFRGRLHGQAAEITANIAVIPDPKSLWISKDSDRADPFWKPDTAFARIADDLLCVAASKRGRSHARDGSFRDDDFGFAVSGGWHIAAVADGAGSARFSRRGSKVAVDCVLHCLPPLLDDHLAPNLGKLVAAHQQGNGGATTQIRRQLYQSLATAAFQAAVAIEDEAAAQDEKPAAFSSTLIICVARLLPEGWFLAGFSVGDGGAAVFDMEDGTLTVLTAPDSGEYAGQTRFLQRSEFAGGFDEVSRRIFFDIRTRFTALALMTDGISDPKFPTETVFADPTRWRAFWTEDLTKAVDFSRDNPDLEQQFLDWLDFWSPGNHDDRTLAVLLP